MADDDHQIAVLVNGAVGFQSIIELYKLTTGKIMSYYAS